MAPSLTTTANGNTYCRRVDFIPNEDATVTSSSTIANTDLSNESKTQRILNGLFIKKKRGSNFTKPKKRRR